MLKALAIAGMMLGLVVVQANPQTHKAKQGQANRQPSTPVASTPVQRANGPALQTKPDQHIWADVRVVSAPPKDRYDKASFWIAVVLAGVGIVGIGVGICTLRFLSRQAVEMRRQRILMRKTLNTMRIQASHMETQTDVLKASVAAAEASAKAASDNVEMVIRKERARLRIEISNLSLAAGFLHDPVKFTVYYHGSTEAFVSNTRVSLDVTDSRDAPERNWTFQSLSVPPVITAKTPVIEYEPFGLHSFTEAEIAQIKGKTRFAHLYGFIEYRDVFERPHRASFYKRWEVTDLKNFDGTEFAYWTDCKRTDDEEDY